MVFLIQNTQNRDAKVMQLKLDELLRAVQAARTGLVDLEDLSDQQLQQLQDEFKRLRGPGLEQLSEVQENVEQEQGERGNGQVRAR
jgi:low affinity Fe/Cu permease